ncbi:PKD domain-containing protein [Hymenobacter jeollabukensis]|uniref:PKD domain-containing protein n=1 Tax=Hymenobacter jeollabukensis TaxID=2025313 RepID=UPI001485513B|nr:PKD domain-containing protein [Hymenobacter jeollabukensis]
MVLATAPPRPQARFAAVDTVSCGAALSFRDQSLNAPTQWRWDFGDGQTSAQQHPQHTYAAAGTYTVKLRACNAAGCDSLTKAGYVTVRADAPRPAPCTPATTAYCCGYGLTRVQLGSIDRRSPDGQGGYEDFSCGWRATLTADRPATLQLTTGAIAHDVRVYLDLNDDGQFTAPAELLYQGLAVQSPSTPLTVPGTAPGLVYNRPLRLRIVADYAGSAATGPCSAPRQGQVEDYSVVVQPNAAPPAAAFAVTYQQFCGPVRVSFANQTTGAATAYAWDFGDGTTSTLASPPAHTFARAGMFEVRLVAHNAAGRDTAWQRACPTYCTPGGTGGSTSSPTYFTGVRLGAIDNQVPRTRGVAYRDFTAQYTTLQIGQMYQFETHSPLDSWSTGGDKRVTLLLDSNQDGFFTASEYLGTVTGSTVHVASFQLPAATKVGATRLRAVVQSTNTATPWPSTTCTPSFFQGATEDYTVVVLPAPGRPRALFSAELPTSCTGTVQFRDSTQHGPTSWRWRFGDGDSAAVQHPRHTYAAPGTYTVSLVVRNRFGADSLTRTGYVTIRSLNSGPVPAACRPAPGTTGSLRAIQTFRIGSALSYGPQPLNAPIYRDETCATPAATLVRGTSYQLTMADRYNAGAAAFVWLDVNNDGVLDPVAELLYDAIPFPVPFGTPRTGTLTLPAATVLGQPLRLRVMFANGTLPNGDFDGVPAPCSQRDADQVRDFTVIATSATASAAGAVPVWTAFPNPSTGAVSLRGDFRQFTEVEVHDVLGRPVYRRRLSAVAGELRLDLTSLPRGVYLLRLPTYGGNVRLLLE